MVHANDDTGSSPVAKRDATPFAVLVTATLTAGFFLRWHYFTGPIGSDDTRYLNFAQSLTGLQSIDKVDHAASRLAFLAIIGIPVRLFGHAYHAAFMNVLLASATDILATFFALKTMGRKAALTVAVLMAFSAIPMVFSSMILPDTSLTLALLIAAILFRRGLDQQPGRARCIQLASAGAAAGIAYACKDPGILFLPPAVVSLGLGKASIRHKLMDISAVVLGLAVISAISGLVFLLYTGDFLYQMHAVGSVHNRRIAALEIGPFVSSGVRMLGIALERDWQWSLLPLTVGVPAMIATAIVSRAWRFFCLLGLFILLYLFFGSSSLGRLIPLPYQSRYLTPVTPFAALACGVLVDRFTRRWQNTTGTILPGVLCLACLGPSLAIAGNTAGMVYGADHYTRARQAIEMLIDSGNEFYVPTSMQGHLEHFLSPRILYRLHAIPPKGDLPPGFYLLGHGQNSDVPAGQLKKVSALPVVMRIAEDRRPANRFRQATPVPSRRPVTVYAFHLSEPCSLACGVTADKPSAARRKPTRRDKE